MLGFDPATGSVVPGGGLAAMSVPGAARAAAPAAPTGPMVFTNIRLFDGTSDTLRTGLRVVVEGQKIKAVEPAGTPPPQGARTLDGGTETAPGIAPSAAVEAGRASMST